MNKKLQGSLLILLLCAAFLFGWRVMPKIWPTIRLNYINRYILHIQPSDEAEREKPLYIPKSNSQYGDSIYLDDSLIYYFYKDTCHYCSELAPLISGLPDQITLPDGSISKVRLLCLNKNEEKYANIIHHYYEENNIPEDQRFVPAIVIGKRYLYLNDSIIDQLMNALLSGEGLDTQMLDGEQRED